MKPILRRLLPHNCIYKKYLGNNGEGDNWEDGTLLSFIKIEKKVQLRVTSNGREIVGNARLFYDCVNSEGLTDDFISNSKIVFNHKEYLIVDIDTFYADSNKPHHYEVLLK